LAFAKIDPMIGDLIVDEECETCFCGEDSVINAREVGDHFSGRVDIFVARDVPMTGDAGNRNEE